MLSDHNLQLITCVVYILYSHPYTAQYSYIQVVLVGGCLDFYIKDKDDKHDYKSSEWIIHARPSPRFGNLPKNIINPRRLVHHKVLSPVLFMQSLK